MLTRTTMIFLSISLIVAGVAPPTSATPLNITERTVGSGIVFDREIEPYIQNKFKEDISDENLIVHRKLLKVNLYRMETINGRDVYSVHLEFVVRMEEKESGFQHTTLRGQEALFIVERGKIKDIESFTEYVIEHNEKELKKKLDSVSGTE